MLQISRFYTACLPWVRPCHRVWQKAQNDEWGSDLGEVMQMDVKHWTDPSLMSYLARSQHILSLCWDILLFHHHFRHFLWIGSSCTGVGVCSVWRNWICLIFFCRWFSIEESDPQHRLGILKNVKLGWESLPPSHGFQRVAGFVGWEWVADITEEFTYTWVLSDIDRVKLSMRWKGSSFSSNVSYWTIMAKMKLIQEAILSIYLPWSWVVTK